MKCRNTTTLVVVILGLFGVITTSSFMATTPLSTRRSLVQQKTQQHEILFKDGPSRCIPHNAVIDSSSIMISESWRQYVPLVVSVGIIIDILLGSPLANMVLKPMRPEEETDEEGQDAKAERPRSKARIDAELVAREALDKAENTLELRNFLEERKTDQDRFDEMKRKLDATMQDLDENMEARQKEIDEKNTN